MSVARGTPFDALFAQLTERMGVLHTAAPDTDPSQRDRVEWKNDGGGTPVNRGYRKQGADFCGFLAVRYQVSVYGATELEVVSRLAELAGWLDYTIGPEQGAADAGDGYLIGASGPIKGGEGDAAGYGCITPITLYQPVYQQIWGRAQVQGVTVNTSVVHSDGTLEPAIVATG